jgi:hypothetical protein
MRVAFWFLLILFFSQLVFIGIYKNTNDISQTINLSGDIIRTFATLGTFAIAILLYDRFGIRKRIIEERVNLVLSLINEVKNLSLKVIIQPGDQSSNKLYLPNVKISKQMKIYKTNTSLMELPIVFEIGDLDEGLDKLFNILNNSLLPIEIKEKLSFLELMSATEFDKNEKHAKIFFTRSTFLSEESKDWFQFDNAKMSLDKFISNFEVFLIASEKWVNKHMNLKIDLNI